MQLKLQLGDQTEEWVRALRQLADLRPQFAEAYTRLPRQGLLAALMHHVLVVPKAPVPDLKPMGSALQNLGRAALQATSSMLSWLGSGAADLLGQAPGAHPADANVIVLFVVGGAVSGAELAAVADVVKSAKAAAAPRSPARTLQVLVGGTAPAWNTPPVL